MGRIVIPIGEENFQAFRESGGYYVDKTKLILELLQDKCKVNLITRPRRFGKTLAMSMLKSFFDIRRSSRGLFEGLEVAGHEELCRNWMNQWPVLSLSLKDVATDTFRKSYEQLAFNISNLCTDHAYLLDSGRVDEDDRDRFARLKAGNSTDAELRNSLYTLTRMLHAHYGKQTILLIDEYDVPLAKGSQYGYYWEILDVIRSMMSTAFKTNDFLKLAVITGCLRIAKESIFTGTNHFKSNSVVSGGYMDCFGFTGDEVAKILEMAGVTPHGSAIKEWYNGYRFGEHDIYCPWDVLNYVSDLGRNPKLRPGNYWRNTSHNDIIRRFIGKEGMDVGRKFETLLAGGSVKVRITEESTYDFEMASESDFWGILYLTGYLTISGGAEAQEESESGEICLRIPNREVMALFRDTVAEWFRNTVRELDRRELFAAVWSRDAEKVSEEMTKLLRRTISYYDYSEEFYHAFLAGIFAGRGYSVESNREHGEGRSDVVVKDCMAARVAVFEAKRVRRKEDLRQGCEKALLQIDRRHYAEEFSDDYDDVICYGISFFRKQCEAALKR